MNTKNITKAELITMLNAQNAELVELRALASRQAAHIQMLTSELNQPKAETKASAETKSMVFETAAEAMMACKRYAQSAGNKVWSYTVRGCEVIAKRRQPTAAA